MSPLLLWSICLAAISVIAILYRSWHGCTTKPQPATDKNLESAAHEVYKAIKPLHFRWDDEPPIALRPFKPKYNLTMAIENMPLDDLVAMDKTYLDRIRLRRRIMQDHSSTFDQRPGSEAVVSEFYSWMTRTYLPQRFPSVYALDHEGEKQSHLHNLVTSEAIPLEPSSTRSALHTLGSHVDTDFLFLLPSQQTGKYHLEAFITTFPSGFSTLDKLGLPLAEIHKPVPGYAAKLEKSMDRFFASIPVGKIVKRANWTITTNDILYSETGTHLYEDDQEDSEKTVDKEQEVQRQKEDVVIENCRLRCERQTLHRLPRSKALVFAFKTYQYTLDEVKADGSGADLAAAIEGLGLGNVPDMKFYKRGVVWGDKVRDHLLRQH